MSDNNIKKFPQCVIEGHTPAKYGVIPTNPDFEAIGQMAMLTDTTSPEFIENNFGGDYDRQGVFKVFEDVKADYEGRLLPTQTDMIKWAFSKPAEAALTPRESRSWLDSYLNNAGTEIFRLWKAAIPESATIELVPRTPTMLKITMTAKTYTEGTSHGITLGTGAFDAGQGPGTPLSYKDAGKFVYDGMDVPFRNFTINANFAHEVQDSNGSENIVYRQAGRRTINGSVDIFKTGQTYNEDARLGKQTLTYLVLHKKGADGIADARFPATGTNYITLASKIPGTFGNDISVIIVTSTETATGIDVDGKTITITLKTAGSTLTELKTAIEADTDASKYVKVTITGTASTKITAAVSKTALSGGTDTDVKMIFERFRFLPSSKPTPGSEATIETKQFEADILTIKN